MKKNTSAGRPFVSVKVYREPYGIRATRSIKKIAKQRAKKLKISQSDYFEKLVLLDKENQLL